MTAEPKQPTAIGTTSRAVANRHTRRYTPRATKSDVARREEDRQRREEDERSNSVPRPPIDEVVRGEEGAADEHEVHDDLDEAPWLEDERAPERRLGRRLCAAARALLEIAEEAPELDEQHEGHEDADRGQPALSSTL